MDRAEIIDLLIVIKENYPNFDASEENINRHFKYLHDFSYKRAVQNVDEHIRTSKFPPNIAEIRGNIGEQMERSRMKTATEEYFEERARAKLEACPPPPGWKEAIYAKLGRV